MSYTDVLARVDHIREQLTLAKPQAPAETPAQTKRFTDAIRLAQQQYAQQAVQETQYSMQPWSTSTAPMDSAQYATDDVSMPEGEVKKAFEIACRRNHVPLNFAMAVGRAESNFRPRAVSAAGAQGIMQLMPATAKGFGVTDSFDPAQNIDAGVRFLRNLLKKYDGNQALALAGYNAGPGAVDRFGGIPPYEETQAYVKRVLGYAQGYADKFSTSTGLPSLRQIQ